MYELLDTKISERQGRVNSRVVKKPRSKFAVKKREHLNRGRQPQQLAFSIAVLIGRDHILSQLRLDIYALIMIIII